MPSQPKNDGDLKKRILPEIADHLRAYGDNEWGKFQKEYNLVGVVSRATFYRWVKEVREGLSPEAIKAVVEVRWPKEEKERPRKKYKRKRTPRTPRPPPPQPKPRIPEMPEVIEAPAVTRAAVMVNPDAVDILSHINEMLDDCGVLRDSAFATMQDGAKKLRNAKLLQGAIRERTAVLNLLLNASERLHSLSRMQQVHSLMMQAIRQASPEVAQDIASRLFALDKEYGLSLGSSTYGG